VGGFSFALGGQNGAVVDLKMGFFSMVSYGDGGSCCYYFCSFSCWWLMFVDIYIY
jgi:hypothetical protein